MELRTLRPNDPNDMAQLLELMGRESLGAYYDWFYNKPPFLGEGETSGLYMLFDDGVCVAHLGTIRTGMLIDRQRVNTVYYADALVSSKVRGKGYAGKILLGCRETCDLVGNVGMNPALHHVYMKHGFHEIGCLVPSFRILNAQAFLRDVVSHGALASAKPYLDHPVAPLANLAGRVAMKAGLAAAELPSRLHKRGVTIDSTRPSLGEIDGLFEEAGPTHRIIAIRDGKFVQWRFWQCPVVKYAEYYARRDGKLSGYAFVKRFRTPEGVVAGVITEAFCARFDSETLSALLIEAAGALQRAGVDFVKIAFSDPWARSVASRLGFVDPLLLGERFKSFGPKVILTGKVDDTNPVVHDLRNWWLTRADSEQDMTDSPKGFERLPPLND